MSTYKVQPVYGELILGWLDTTMYYDSLYTADQILRTVEWQFKGGLMGDYPMRFPSEYTAVRFPNGMSGDIASEGEWGVNYTALQALLARRRVEATRARRSRADWASSLTALRAFKRDRLGDPDTPAYTGLHAVYVMVKALWDSSDPRRHTRHWAGFSTYLKESVIAAAAPSHLHVPTCAALTNSTLSALRNTRIEALTECLAGFDRAMRNTGSAAARQSARAVGRRLYAGDLNAHTCTFEDIPTSKFSVGGLTVYALHGCMLTCAMGRVLVLSRSDIQRVHQMMTGACSGLFATVAQACVAPGRERVRASAIAQAYEAQVDRILRAAMSVKPGDEVYVCKAFKRAFSAFLGELSGSLCEPETRELWAETRSTRYAEVMELDAWVGECRRWSAGTAFNIGKVYKLCPAPDASPALTLMERHEMVTNRNVITPDALVALTRVHRDQMLRAHIRCHGVKLELRDPAVRPEWWAAYRAGRFDDVPTAQIHAYLAWEGTATMPDRAPDDPSVWKDSGLGWDTVEVAVDPSREARHGNMLTRMIFDNDAPMPGTRHYRATHDHKIDTKPEGHKDPARGIYSGNLADRLNQSWMEAAVESVAREHPAFMIGASASVRDERVKAIVSRTHKLDEVDVYYSFDISGWSPHMPPEAQEMSHRNWAALFDEELFRCARAINEGARIYMNKAGYTGWFTNPGANLEGYNGKEMTMILVSLMALAVERWRETIVHEGLATAVEASRWAAILLAYIDDGLAKLTLPRRVARALFKRFQEITVSTFSECGYTVEISKCYPSDRFAIFLNEPYLAGRHVTHGTRAAMTICAENTEPHTTLVERVSSVSTGCRGAVMAGLDAITGVMLQAYHTYKHLQEWTRFPDPVAAAVWSFAPRAWGGLGLPTALQLGTSGGGAAVEESVQTIQAWAKISMPARKYFLNCARQTMRDRNPMGVLLAPLGGRLREGVMVETRVPDAVRDALTKLRERGELSKLASEFLMYASPDSLLDFAERILPMAPPTVVQEQLLSDLASAHPHSIFSAFARRIEKSSTLISLIGTRAMNRILKDNRRDAAESYSAARRTMM